MDVRYPIGTYTLEGQVTPHQRNIWIEEIEELPEKLREAVTGLTENQLDLSYREGGWALRQVVHHVADSHMNSFIRFKLALTEELPTIKPYFEDRWAELSDSKYVDAQLSLSLLDGLHKRWTILLRSMEESDFLKQFYHPESKQTVHLDYNLGLYAWHGKHHTAQITTLRHTLNI